MGALGVVYGDIGTSPLYAMRECFVGPHAVAPTPEHVLGILSLFLWSLTMVVSFKYLTFVMRADNQGEGGVLALLALVNPQSRKPTRLAQAHRAGLLLLGLFGAALLYGDGVITPAISVLSAVEGLGVATEAFQPVVVPLTVVVLVALFLVQRSGTAGIGAVFGPLMVLWFVTIGALGAAHLWNQATTHTPVWAAVDPRYAIDFLTENGLHGFLILGSVVLCITGGEALYADMGHFGARPIRYAWWVVAFPCLLLNYFGQGVHFLENGAAVEHPFFEMAPSWGLYPLVALSTMATIIASQALISGVFSLTQQAIQLGYSPRFTIVHTSGSAHGQIYLPEVNFGLAVMCVLLVVGFGRSSALAGAYGIAVTGTMGITSILFYVVARERWGWSRLHAGALLGLFLIFDMAYFGANLVKFADGGWFPLSLAGVVFVIMTTWKRGRAELGRVFAQASLPLDLFLADLASRRPYRVEGTAVFMASNPEGVPMVLLHQFKHNKVLHERVVLLSMIAERRPEVPTAERVTVKDLGQGFWRVIARFGFMETPTVPAVAPLCAPLGLVLDPASTTFFLGRETLLATGSSRMSRWRKRLFAIVSRNAPTATAFFEIPPNRVVELGAQIEL